MYIHALIKVVWFNISHIKKNWAICNTTNKKNYNYVLSIWKRKQGVFYHLSAEVGEMCDVFGGKTRDEMSLKAWVMLMEQYWMISQGSRRLTVFDSHACWNYHWSCSCPMEHRVSNQQPTKCQKSPVSALWQPTKWNVTGCSHHSPTLVQPLDTAIDPSSHS